MKKKLCLLFGGKSAEHEVSLQTAKAVIKALDLTKFEIDPVFISPEGEWRKGLPLEGPVESVEALQFGEDKTVSATEGLQSTALTVSEEKKEGYDIVFPLLHGPNGEDGTVQGLLEVLNVPYVGNGVLASSAGMDKVIMKNLFKEAGLPQVNYVSFIRSAWEADREAAYSHVEKEISYPCFIKPANLGSSVGISKCTDRKELEAGFEEAFLYDRKIIVEQGVKAREIEIGVLGNDYPEMSVPGEIVAKKDFYDYKAKYVDGDSVMIIPAELPEGIAEILQEMAKKAFQAVDCSGLVRADFFLTENNEIFINEINTMPGFTPYSMFPLLWENTGVSYPELIERLVELGIERHKEKQRIKYSV
ncbi:D-alanine--D-alanine ligase [Jeotgalibacillus proteolyticus]|uniref:D-alanine--D-alanine ligase n=1 Tax=Jeotgalibacillus proteolyticus TaxID=2082395 RepID=A0A2S5GC78_9BACL|nr:D-alanine--D-alanine ligase [Jeotgalibacillus proteolyticus]PPA70558.1 D-alanine--D-alanine ligase [Jeotgalibacillus proteolyticus]